LLHQLYKIKSHDTAFKIPRKFLVKIHINMNSNIAVINLYWYQVKWVPTSARQPRVHPMQLYL